MTKIALRASQIRQRLLRIPSEIAAQIQPLVRPRALLRGYVYRTRRRCGKPGCHCARGERHEAWVIATKVGRQRTTRSLGGQQRHRIEKLAANYRKFRQAQKAIRQLHREAMELTAQLENLLAEQVYTRRGRR